MVMRPRTESMLGAGSGDAAEAPRPVAQPGAKKACCFTGMASKVITVIPLFHPNDFFLNLD